MCTISALMVSGNDVSPGRRTMFQFYWEIVPLSLTTRGNGQKLKEMAIVP